MTRARKICFVLPPCSAKVTVVSTSNIGLPFSSSAALVKTSLSGFNDFPVNAGHWIDGAIRAAHVNADGATGPSVQLAYPVRKSLRTPPLRHALCFGPGFEHQLSRGVKDSRYTHLRLSLCQIVSQSM